MEIETVRDLLDFRAQLKKFKNLPPKKVLVLLKCIKECQQINKEWIRKTRITKTLTKIALHKFKEENDFTNMITKFCKYLIQKYKLLFPHLQADQDNSKQADSTSQASKIQQKGEQKVKQEMNNNPPKSENLNKPSALPEQKTQQLPVYENNRRNQGLQGILKYIQKGLEENMMNLSMQIAIAIEQYLNDINTQNAVFEEVGYKEGIKKICTIFLDKEKGADLKEQVFKEYNPKQTGPIECIKRIFS